MDYANILIARLVFLFLTVLKQIRCFTMRFISLLIIVFCSMGSHIAVSADALDGFIGTPPAKILWIIKQLEATRTHNNGAIKNRLILHGPPGNGKSLLAKKIADAVQFVFFQIDGPSIVNKFQGSGAEKIAETFKEIFEAIEQYNVNFLLFIDEIDAIAGDNDDANRSEHKAALQQLWLELDKCKHNPRIFIVFATNHFKKLDKTFLDRFGNNIIEIKNPNAKTRRAVISHYFAQYALFFDEKLLNELVDKTRGLSIRSLEDLAADVYIEAQAHNNGIPTEKILFKTIKEIRKKFDKKDDASWKATLERTNLYVSITGGVLLAIINSCTLGAWLMNGYCNSHQ